MARLQNPKKFILRGATWRAKKHGVPFSITEADISIPDVCPVLGIKLERSATKAMDASPSLDRIIPELGYVPGNVAVISNRANRLKNDGTAEEHYAVAGWLERVTIHVRSVEG